MPNLGFENGQVLTMAVIGTDLFVGGYFMQTGDGALTDLGNITRYDTVNHSWHALANHGLSAAVYALEASGSDLYVGGAFTMSGDGTHDDLVSIARYDTLTDTWHALPSQGLVWDANNNYAVHAMAVSGDGLFVGGRFTQTSDGTLVNLGNVARYRFRDSTWHSLPSRGVDDMVYSLAVDGTDLFVGGYLTQTGDGALTDLGRIVRFDSSTDTWQAMPDNGLAAVGAGVCKVDTMAVHDSDLYVGGGFTHAGDGTPYDLGGIARFGTPKECMRCVYLPRAAR